MQRNETLLTHETDHLPQLPLPTTIYHSFHIQHPLQHNRSFQAAVPFTIQDSSASGMDNQQSCHQQHNGLLLHQGYCQRLILWVGGILVSGVRAKEISQLECQAAERRAEQRCAHLLRQALVVRPDSYFILFYFFRVWWFLGLYAGRSALWMGKQHS